MSGFEDFMIGEAVGLRKIIKQQNEERLKIIEENRVNYEGLLATRDDELNRARLGEANWWAGGDHAGNWEGSGCEIFNCHKCRRLKELSEKVQKMDKNP